MIVFEACLAVLVLEALVFRGRLVRLAQLRIRRLWLVWLALLDQFLVISILPGSASAALAAANLGAYVAAGAFVWINRRIPGIVLIAIGGGCNVAAIAANHGTMPASATALRASGWRPSPGHFVNSAVVAHPRLSWLGDIFSTPHWLPGHDVFSVGDVLVIAGIALLVALTCRKPPAPERAPEAGSVAPPVAAA